MIREEPQRVADGLRARGVAFPLDELLALDSEWRRFLQEAEELRKGRNENAQAAGREKDRLSVKIYPRSPSNPRVP